MALNSNFYFTTGSGFDDVHRTAIEAASLLNKVLEKACFSFNEDVAHARLEIDQVSAAQVESGITAAFAGKEFRLEFVYEPVTVQEVDRAHLMVGYLLELQPEIDRLLSGSSTRRWMDTSKRIYLGGMSLILPEIEAEPLSRHSNDANEAGSILATWFIDRLVELC